MTEKTENAAEPEAAAPEKPDDAALLQRIQALEEEAAALRDQRIRALAEADNARKRGQREAEEAAKYGITGFARDLVNVLENLKRAAETGEAHKDQGSEELLKSLNEGVALTLKELLSVFDKYHIRCIDPAGQKFDHNFHQAVVQVERDDVPPGTVVQVVQAGYVIHDRLLRPAMVAVSKSSDKKDSAPKTVDTVA